MYRKYLFFFLDCVYSLQESLRDRLENVHSDIVENVGHVKDVFECKCRGFLIVTCVVYHCE